MVANQSNELQKIIAEYSKDYCDLLELAYGHGMMSEGGVEGIEQLFDGITIQNKRMLDIGFGLGGVAIYLAGQYDSCVSGIEINVRMVIDAAKRIPRSLQHLLSFHTYEKEIPFGDATFDIVYSKGVLCHLENKTPLFREVYRVLKPGGEFVVIDWLSPSYQWGKYVKKMCDIEDLTFFAETEKNYCFILEQSKFEDIKVRDDNQSYSRFNREIINRLGQKNIAELGIKQFGEKIFHDAVESYSLIEQAIENCELLIRRFRSRRSI